MEIQDLMIVGEEEIVIKDIYYVLMKCGYGNVRQCKNIIRQKSVFINQICIDTPLFQVSSDDQIVVNHNLIEWPFVYYMLNKPKGYICAHKDQRWPCVMDLIRKDDCYCVGRLDRDTTGLLLITNDVNLSKKLLLPQNHIKKTYFVTVDSPLKQHLIKYFRDGIVIDFKIRCQSAQLEIIDSYHCYVTLCEGRYHQVKKMFLTCGYHVVELKRVSFADILLDEQLAEGEYRYLTKKEFQKLEIILSQTKKRL